MINKHFPKAWTLEYPRVKLKERQLQHGGKGGVRGWVAGRMVCFLLDTNSVDQ